VTSRRARRRSRRTAMRRFAWLVAAVCGFEVITLYAIMTFRNGHGGWL
jgi:hypothetical protein